MAYCKWSITVEPQFNEVLDTANDTLRPGQNYSKMYAIEPRYNEFLDITNIIRKPKRKIYLDITNYNVNTRQKLNAEQINRSIFQSTAYYVIDIGIVAFPQKSPVLQISH